MHNLAIRITDYLISKDILNTSERNFYIYGCEILLLKIVNVGTLLCIALAMGNPVEGIILLSTFMTLRKYTGGFHLNSALWCYIFTAFVYGISLSLCVNYKVCEVIYLSVALILEIIIASLPPINNANINLTENEMCCMKKQVKRTLLFLYVIIVLLIWLEMDVRYISPIVMGLVLDGIFVVLSILKDKEGKS